MLNKARRWLALLMGIMMLLSAVPTFAATGADPCANGHKWSSWEYSPVAAPKKPTCTEPGSEQYRTCLNCKKQEFRREPALGHNWKKDKTLKEATCIEKGEVRQRCSRCDETRTVKTDYGEHKYGAWTVVTQPEEYSAGVEARTCSVCDKVQERALYPEGTLKRGDKGDGVRELQENLNDAGYNCGNPDGDFGGNTEKAVKAAQEAFGMNADGIAWPGLQAKLGHEWSEWYVLTPATDRSMGVEERKCEKPDCGSTEQREFYPEGTLKRGDKGDAVLGLQELLNENGYDCGTPDGDFGGKTESAVKKVEAALGMEQDGIAWPAVQAALAPYGAAPKTRSLDKGTDAKPKMTIKTLNQPTGSGPFKTYQAGETIEYVVEITNTTEEYLVHVVVEMRCGDESHTETSAVFYAPGDTKKYTGFEHVVTEEEARSGICVVTFTATYEIIDDEEDAQYEIGGRYTSYTGEYSGTRGVFVHKSIVNTPANGHHFVEDEKILFNTIIVNVTSETLQNAVVTEDRHGSMETIATLDIAPGHREVISSADYVNHTDYLQRCLYSYSVVTWDHDKSDRTQREKDGDGSVSSNVVKAVIWYADDFDGPNTEPFVQVIISASPPANSMYYMKDELIELQYEIINTSKKTAATDVRLFDLEFVEAGFNTRSFGTLKPLETCRYTRYYVVKDNDAWKSEIRHQARVDAWDEQTGVYCGSYSNTLILPVRDTVEMLDCQYLLINQVLSNTPQNGEYYVPGESVEIKVSVYLGANGLIKGLDVYDYMNTASGPVEEELKDINPEYRMEDGQIYRYTVTEADAARGWIRNDAAVFADVWNIISLPVEGGLGGIVEYDYVKFYATADPLIVPCGMNEEEAKVTGELTVTKELSNEPENGEYFTPGETALFAITVQNKTNVDMVSVEVVDHMNGADGIEEKELGVIRGMASGDVKTFVFPYQITEADAERTYVTNSARASGYDAEKNEYSAESKSVSVSCGMPAEDDVGEVMFVKSASAPGNTVAFMEGETITYSLTVTNDTNQTISDVEISDPLKGGNEDAVVTMGDVLEPGASQTYSFDYTVKESDVLAGSIVNTANLRWWNETSQTTDELNSNTVTVMTAAVSEAIPPVDNAGTLTMVQSVATTPANGVYYVEGETIQYQFIVTNSTDKVLYSIRTYNCLTNEGIFGIWYQLEPSFVCDGTMFHVVTTEDVARGYIENTGVIEWSEEPRDGVINSTTSNTVTVQTGLASDMPGVSIIIREISTPTSGAYYVNGETITYEVTVRNDGDDDIGWYRVDGLKLHQYDNSFYDCGELGQGNAFAAGQAQTFTYNYVVEVEDLNNASVTALAVINFTYGNGNHSIYSNRVGSPVGGRFYKNDLSVEKRETSAPANGQFYVLGETITYEITVKNNGDVAATDVVVYDTMINPHETEAAMVREEIGRLEQLVPGAAKTFSFSHVVDEWNVKHGEMWNEASMSCTYDGDYGSAGSETVKSPTGSDSDNPESTATSEHDYLIEKTVLGDPANGQFYVQGEAITFLVHVDVDESITELSEFCLVDLLLHDGEGCILAYPQPGASDYTFDYIVTSEDVQNGSVSNTAWLQWNVWDDDQNCETMQVNSNTVTVETGVNSDATDTPEPTPETDKPESYSVTLNKTTIGAPANGQYYVPGEVVHYEVLMYTNHKQLLDVVVKDVLAPMPLAVIDNMVCDGNPIRWTFDYTITEWDALNGSVTNIATLEANDENGQEISASSSLTVPTGFDGPFGVITEMTIVKSETSTPANGSYYTEGEVITYDITIRNDGETHFGECIIYDSQAVDDIGSAEHLYVGEERHVDYNHTITAQDVAAGYVLNTAWVVYDINGYSETKQSNTVVSDTDGSPDAFDPEAPGKIETPVMTGGEGYVPCSHELLAKGDNGEETLTHYCELHVDTQETVAELIAAAATDDEMLSAWTQASEMWRAEIDEMYEAMMNVADPIAKINIMDDRFRFYTAVGCHEKLLSMIYPDAPAQVASMIAEALMNKCVDMCYELHTAPTERIDAFEHVSAFEFDLPCGEDCVWNFTSLDNGDIRIAEQLCAHHASVLQIRNRLLADSGNTEEAWKTVGQLWKIEVNTGYNGLYIALDEDGQTTVLADYKAFEYSVNAHEKVLRALYDRPEVVNEVLAQIMKDRATEICSFK